MKTELEAHIMDQMEDYRNEESRGAMERAILEMGDPVKREPTGSSTEDAGEILRYPSGTVFLQSLVERRTQRRSQICFIPQVLLMLGVYHGLQYSWKNMRDRSVSQVSGAMILGGF